jgi:flagellar motor switch protein FliN/FliY
LARLKKEVAAQPLAKVAAPDRADHVMAYRLTTSDGGVLQLSTVLDASLVAALTLQPPEPPAKTAVATLPPPPSAPSTRNLELLLDVELPVSVSFGRAQLQLKDVIKLTTGSIVELNRSVSEPVDIIVNNCVIARGEVVVIEGNFGVRIKQIVSKEDRLRSLG